MESSDLVTLFLGGGGLGAAWAMVRWYLKERMQRSLDEVRMRQEVQHRRDELAVRKLEHEQKAMSDVFDRLGNLSDRLADLIFELAVERRPTPRNKER
jgi:hypothetical protein